MPLCIETRIQHVLYLNNFNDDNNNINVLMLYLIIYYVLARRHVVYNNYM